MGDYNLWINFVHRITINDIKTLVAITNIRIKHIAIKIFEIIEKEMAVE